MEVEDSTKHSQNTTAAHLVGAEQHLLHLHPVLHLPSAILATAIRLPT